jgi:hypothetical protein
MLPIAALIVTADDQPDGLEYAERAALMARRAGINYAYFTGPRQPDLAMLRRLRAQGVFGSDLLGWPRLFSGLPAAERVVVMEARAEIDADGLAAVVRDAMATPQSAALAVDIGPDRKNSLLRVTDGRITSVMGDGNAMSIGIVVIPSALLARLATVRSMTDALHRLARIGRLQAVPMALLTRPSTMAEWADRLGRVLGVRHWLAPRPVLRLESSRGSTP